MESKINQIIIDATNMQNNNRGLRFGQCIAIVTHKIYPSMIYATVIDNDCYYEDSKVEAFLNTVREYEASILKMGSKQYEH